MPVKRGKRWGARVYVGGRKYRWLGTFDSRREALKAEANAVFKKMDKHSCASYADKWLERAQNKVSPSTYLSYKYAVVRFKTQFGHLKLDQLDRDSAKDWALRQPKFAVRAAAAVFADALDSGLVMSNPFANLRIKRVNKRQQRLREKGILTEEDVERMADCAEVLGPYGPTFRAMILFAAYSGMREGEIFALRWDAIDLERGEITVRQSVDSLGNLKAPKNDEARTILLFPPAKEALLSLPRRLDSPYVFLTKRGVRFRKGSLYECWHEVRAAYGDTSREFGELRHACATMLLERGVSKDDARLQLGHKDSWLIERVYGHPSEDNARNRIRQAFQEVTLMEARRG